MSTTTLRDRSPRRLPDGPAADLTDAHTAVALTAEHEIPLRPGAPVGRRPARRLLVGALRPFLVFSVLAFVVVAAGTVAWSGHIAEREALTQAKATGRGVADGIIAPLVTDALTSGDPAAMAQLDSSVRNRMRDGSMYRVKIWTADQRVLYSDETGLIGREFVMEPDDVALFGTTGASAAISHLAHDENIYERAEGTAVEVYVGFTGADGRPLVFEAYLPTGPLRADAHRLWAELLPLTLGSMALLLALLMPLAVAMARRVERVQGERNRMLHAAIGASDNERRRIARDLHDGVIQDLVGLSYSLSAVVQDLPQDGAHASSRELTRSAATVVRRDVESLRTLIADIYPPELNDGQLRTAVAELLGTGVGTGVVTTLRAPRVMDVPPDTAVLVYRVVREALRNVVKHAGASAVRVELSLGEGRLTAVVVDDGVGMGPAAQRGHLGLRLLADTVTEAGGTFTIWSHPGAGVRVTASVPLSC